MADITFCGPAGRIEAKYHHGPTNNCPIAIVLHPHPKHGGTMNNKVVHAIYKCFVRQGFSVLRFNFRGIGRSEGVYDGGEGELSDAASAIDWLQATYPQVGRFWVAGFSFGSWIGMQLLMRRPEIEGFVSISPPAGMYDFNFLAPCPVSGHIAQGSLDPIVNKSSVDMLVSKIRNQKGIHIDYNVIDGADHFFTNHMDALSDGINRYLDSRLSHYNQRIAV